MVIRLTTKKRKNRHNRNTVYISIQNGRSGTAGSIQKLITTNVDVQLKDWDRSNSLVKSSDPNFKVLNYALSKIKERMVHARTKLDNNQMTIQQAVNYLKGNASYDTIDEYLDTVMQPKLKPTTYQSYKGVIKAFKKHLNIPQNEGLDFKSLIGYSNLETFKINAQKAGISGVSLNSYFKQMAAIYNDAYNNEVVFEKFEVHKNLRPKNTRPKPLQTASAQLFYDAIKKSKNLYDCQTLGLYLLMFACRGMYQADIVQMTADNVELPENHSLKRTFRLNHFRHKTKDTSSDLMQINVSMEMYGLISLLKYSFIYTHSHLRPEVLADYEDVLAIFNYDVNEKLLHTGLWNFYGKNCKRLLGMPFKTARKTFNTVALELAIPETIRRILLGHTDTSMLRHYDNIQAKRIQEQVDKAHLSILEKGSFVTMYKMLCQKIESLNPDYSAITKIFSEPKEWSDNENVLKQEIPKIKDGLKIPRYKN